MDDSTKTMLQTLAIGAVQKAFMLGGATLGTYGLATGNLSTAAYGALATAVVAAGTSFWRDYGRAIFISQLEVLKARSIASAKKIQDAGLAPVTTVEIAAQSPTLTPAQVVKVAATMPAPVASSVVPITEAKKVAS